MCDVVAASQVRAFLFHDFFINLWYMPSDPADFSCLILFVPTGTVNKGQH